MPNIPWSDVTREERYFTSTLFHDIQKDPQTFWDIVRSNPGFSTNTRVIDQGYEVCFFRDAHHEGLIKQQVSELEKQTFDLVLTLSNNELVIIEAKAQQGFHSKQIEMLHCAREIMLHLSNPKWQVEKIYLVALCSSKYRLRSTTAKQFNAVVRWNVVAKVYPTNRKIYQRADDIYRK